MAGRLVRLFTRSDHHLVARPSAFCALSPTTSRTARTMMRRAFRNSGPLGRPPQFLISPKESLPNSPANSLKAIPKAPYFTVLATWYCACGYRQNSVRVYGSTRSIHRTEIRVQYSSSIAYRVSVSLVVLRVQPATEYSTLLRESTALSTVPNCTYLVYTYCNRTRDGPTTDPGHVQPHCRDVPCAPPPAQHACAHATERQGGASLPSCTP